MEELSGLGRMVYIGTMEDMKNGSMMPVDVKESQELKAEHLLEQGWNNSEGWKQTFEVVLKTPPLTEDEKFAINIVVENSKANNDAYYKRVKHRYGQRRRKAHLRLLVRTAQADLEYIKKIPFTPDHPFIESMLRYDIVQYKLEMGKTCVQHIYNSKTCSFIKAKTKRIKGKVRVLEVLKS